MIEIRRPQVRAIWEGGRVATDSLQIGLQMDSEAEVSIGAYSGPEAAQSAQQVFAGDSGRLMQRAQLSGLSPRSEPNLLIRAEDGTGKSVDIPCFVIGPGYTMDRNGQSVRPSVKAVVASALLDNLRLDIYRGAGREVDTELTNRTTLLTKRKFKTNLAVRLKQLTEAMINIWESDSHRYSDPVSISIQQAIHENNKIPLELWYKLLDNSSEGLDMPWMEALEESPAANMNLNAEILKILRGQSDSFMGVVRTLNEEFDLHYLPNLDGTPGKLVSRGSLVSGRGRGIDMPAHAVIADSGGASSLLPVQQVVIVGSPDNLTLGAAEQVYGSNAMIPMVAYPEEVAAGNGNIKTIPLPLYLSLAIIGEQKPQSSTSPPTVESAKKAFRSLRKLTSVILSKTVKGLIQSYAKSVYASMALAGSRVTLVAPLDLSWQVGVRFSVLIGGEPVFSGLLESLQHRLSRGSAETVLTFIYVEYGTFRLPDA
jgi:hypothetical protein